MEYVFESMGDLLFLLETDGSRGTFEGMKDPHQCLGQRLFRLAGVQLFEFQHQPRRFLEIGVDLLLEDLDEFHHGSVL
jgi:hypothetical protein